MVTTYKKNILLIIGIIALFSFSSCTKERAEQKSAKGYLETITTDKSSYNLISFQKVLEKIANNDTSMFIVDIRKAEDYQKGHLPGAVNIAYSKIGESMDRLPKNKDILVYCYSGQTSGQAIAAMRIMGFNAYSIKSGMKFGWTSLKLPTESLETKVNPVPEKQSYQWTAEEKDVLKAIKSHFSKGTNYVVKAPAVNKILNSDPLSIGILDIRNEKAFKEGHIERAILIPFAELAANLSKIPTNKPVYIYCFSGQTAGQSLLALRLYGIDVYSISRGMKGWAGANLPVVGESSKATSGGGCE